MTTTMAAREWSAIEASAPRTVVRTSGNAKVGRHTVTTARVRESCPQDCDLWHECYGANVSRTGQTLFANVETAPNGGPDIVAAILRPSTRAVRFGVVGDYLRDDGRTVDRAYIDFTNGAALVAKDRGLPVWSYTHAWSPSADRDHVTRDMFAYTVRASCGSWEAASAAAAAGWAPAVAIDADDPRIGTVVDGRRVVVCPAQRIESVACDSCGLCAREGVTVAFIRHGAASMRIARQRRQATIGADGRVTYSAE